jgi:signal transduction histidine kinase
MVNLFYGTTRKKAVSSPHFWAIVVIIIVVIVLYISWPWREAYFSRSIWHWIPGLLWLSELAVWEFKYHIVGCLLFIPTIYAAVFFGLRGALIAWFVSFIGILPLILGLWLTPWSLALNIGFLILPIFAVSAIALEVRIRLREREHYDAREQEHRMYISKMLEVQENERQRIARDLHDETIQTLLVIANYAESILSNNGHNTDDVNSKATLVRDTTLDTVDNLRAICLDLRPSVLDNLGLIAALRLLVDHINEEYKIQVQFSVTGEVRKLDTKIQTNIFRVVQEALSNIKRHSKASEALVALTFTEKSLQIKIQDNGQGFDSKKGATIVAGEKNFGLIGMQERVEAMSGKFNIRTKSNKGTTLFIGVKC